MSPWEGREAFRAALLDWYDANKRPLPWRDTTDPYKVWVSEAMLQQTTVAVVLPYYERWLQHYPDLETLVRAHPDEPLALWSGLGYYARCRRLVQAMRSVAADGWPQSESQWLALPGVGPYTAAALGSITQGLPLAVVDGNVERVYARLQRDATPRTRLKSAAQKWAATVLDASRPGDWNQAVMELGALVCRPKRPDCDSCPVRGWCHSHAQGDQDAYPSRPVRQETREARHHILVPVCRGRVGLVQAGLGEWWEGMWGALRGTELNALVQRAGARSAVNVGRFQHTVTRHRLTVEVSVCTLETESFGLRWATWDEAHALALPAPQRKALEMALGSLVPGAVQPTSLDTHRHNLVDGQESQAVEADCEHRRQDPQSVPAGEALLATKAEPGFLATGAFGEEEDRAALEPLHPGPPHEPEHRGPQVPGHAKRDPTHSGRADQLAGTTTRPSSSIT